VIAMSQEAITETTLEKSFTFVMPIEKIVDAPARIIEGYASTTNVDEEGDIIAKEALAYALDDYMKYPTVRFMHQREPIGKTIDAKVDDRGLFVRVQITDKTNRGNEVWGLIEDGIVKGFSIGGRVIAAKRYFDKNLKRNVTKITKMKLIEISLVDSPANRETLFSVIGKSLELDNKEDYTDEEIALLATATLLKEKSPYINPDGTFKGGFEGCVKHFTQIKHMPEENARKLCAYIGRKAGKIPKIMEVTTVKEETVKKEKEEVEKVEKEEKKEEQKQDDVSKIVNEKFEELRKYIDEKFASIREIIEPKKEEKRKALIEEAPIEKTNEKAEDEPFTIKKFLQKMVGV